MTPQLSGAMLGYYLAAGNLILAGQQAISNAAVARIHEPSQSLLPRDKHTGRVNTLNCVLSHK